jgi:hypothetical protein
MTRPRLTEKVVRGLAVAFASVGPSTITPGNDLGAANVWLEGMRRYYATPKQSRGRPDLRRRRPRR